MNPLAADTTRSAAALPPAARQGSLVELLRACVVEAYDRPAIVDGLAASGCDRGAREWTWGELAAAALGLAEAFAAAGLSRGDRVAHLGRHAPDWILVDVACLLAGLVHVPLHADESLVEHRGHLGWLAPRGVIFSSRVAGLAPRDLAGTIVFDLVDHRGGLGLRGRAWRPLTAAQGEVGDRLGEAVQRCDPDAPAVIVLSSGTTGRPHGVIHSQRSLAANACAAASVFLDDPRDVRLSWLPLSHSLALTGDLHTALVRGACLNVVGERTRVLDACRALPPTVILGVPAFFERLERGAVSGRIGDLAAALGGAVRVCVSGGAPLRRRTAEFFAARGLPLVDGYGLAEAGPVVALASPRTARIGTVGPPLPGVEVRLDDRPATRGQLLVRTPGRCVGVIAPTGDAPAADADDGWLATGDLAEIDAAGHLRIKGRLGDVVVLSNGVKLPPAAVEAALAEDDAVAQVCVVVSDAGRPVAVVVPEPAILRAAIARMGLLVASRRQAVRHPRVVRWLARRLGRRQGLLPRPWRVRQFVMLDRPFDPARGEVTASQKPRRGVIAKHHGDRLRAATEARGSRAVDEAAPGAEAGVRRSWLAAALWHARPGGFAAAAAAAAEPLPDRIEAVLERAETEIAILRTDGLLYGSVTHEARPAPLTDAPPPPAGVFTAAAESALGEVGLWGLAVPEDLGGSGGSMLDLAQATTRLAANVPTAAGMLAVHSSIGAVSALVGFGSADQRSRLLPGLAAGRPLSIFAATEADAGCDLGRVTTAIEERDGRLLLTGTKMFITGAAHGRLVKLLAVRSGKPAVVLVRLPDADTATFRLHRYALHPLKHAHNAALEFCGFEIDPRDVLQPAGDGDAMAIIWHGLYRGRVTLAAQAAGTLRLLAAHAREHAQRRITWGQPIAARELIQARFGRIVAATMACDALSAWAAAAIDSGQGGEWEAITAKVLASHCVRDAAIDALGIHGGRAFLVGHPLGDSFHDHFAVSVYEGESDLLGLALFKGLARHHPLASSRHAAAWRRAADWVAWRTGLQASAAGEDGGILDRGLRRHARSARRRLGRLAVAIDRALRRYGRSLAERQLQVAALSAAVRDATSVLAVAHHADARGDDRVLPAADAWCRMALARAAGRPPTPDDLAAVARAGRDELGA